MTTAGTPDPIEAMAQFLARIAPFDAHPDLPVMTVEMRIGRSRDTFEVTERAARALREALNRYVDPDDCGRCRCCDGHLDRNLQCRSCGHVDGVFGATLVDHTADMARRADQ